MEINNAIVPVNLIRPLIEGGNSRAPQTGDSPADASRSRGADRIDRETVDPVELQRRVEQKQASQAIDVSRFQPSETVSLNSQQAINTYQQTEVAAQEFEGGVLVGIDLFA
ncbi:hypothetical protein [Alkalimarinus coralli]|uniref:hypothetical protein n=1 Tax=Alkalimarinus coralli TaxID=2935863 RepID=UPI00202B64DA|nr:hypothetical protein [Alkalimarinus coralli]